MRNYTCQSDEQHFSFEAFFVLKKANIAIVLFMLLLLLFLFSSLLYWCFVGSHVPAVPGMHGISELFSEVWSMNIVINQNFYTNT